MGERFEIRKLDSGWAVWDTALNTPAAREGRWLTDMPMEEADDLTDLLNRLDAKAKSGGPQ